MTGAEPHVCEPGRMDHLTYVALDVHQARVCVTVAEGGRGGKICQVGVFENSPDF